MKVTSPTEPNSGSARPLPRKRGKGSADTFIKSVRSSLVKTIKVQTGLDVTPQAQQYFNIVDLWMKAEGKRSAVLRLKNVSILALNSMNSTPKIVGWLRTNKRGFPRRFEFLETFYRKQGKSPQAMQAVLSLLNYYRGILAPGTPDLSSITEEGSDIPDSLLEEILDLGFNPDWKFHPKRILPTKMLMRAKQGPNGPATLTAALEVKALPDELYTSLVKLLAKSDDKDLVGQSLKMLRMKSKLVPGTFHSRISIKRELGGKDRAFAMVDYWSQVALHPLHQKLADILGSLSQDCTFDQSSGKEDFARWTTSGSAVSFDLTAASDRFPISLQKKMIERLTDDAEYAQHWGSIMADRQFRYKSKDYKWAVGQPLGALSSWPSFALAHHLVMRAAFKKANIPEMEYYILGDDMAMKRSEATTYYKDFMEKLGVKFSTLKGLENYTLEFAKRIWNRGVEVSPVPCAMLQTMLKDYVLIAEFIAKVKERSSDVHSDLRVSELTEMLAKWFNKPIEFISILTEYPIPLMRSALRTGNPDFSGTPVSWNGLDTNYGDLYRIFDEIRYKKLISKIDECSRRSAVISRSLQALELPGTPNSLRRMHPIYTAHGNYSEEIDSAREEMRGYLSNSRGHNLSITIRVSKITDLQGGSISRARHDGKQILELFNLLKERKSVASQPHTSEVDVMGVQTS